jgi:hypothetical protein
MDFTPIMAVLPDTGLILISLYGVCGSENGLAICVSLDRFRL